jgi:nucleoside-diphosphate-sugar epimerase
MVSSAAGLPSHFESISALEEFLSRPRPEVIQALQALDGDILILGVGGKMGPTLAALARRSCDEAGLQKRIIGVSRFSAPGLREELQRWGVETIACDLLDEDALRALPQIPNIIYMPGMKFGATGREAQTWAMNAFLPGLVARTFRHSRVVLFSSGNVYPFVPAMHGGSTEADPPAPVGEYAQSVLGRERVFEYFASQYDVLGVLFRLNYAVELRYGVLLDIARLVWAGQALDLRMGHFNCIWQGDANAYALRALELAEVPPRVLNVTGPETASVRSVALRFGALLGKDPVFVGSEEPHALLSNAGLAHRFLGYPRVPLEAVIEWVAEWVRSGGTTLDKPTKFQVRDGKF